MLLNEISAPVGLGVNHHFLEGSHGFLQVFIFCLLTDGQHVASTTLIDTLLDKDFQLIINDEVYDVKSPEKGTTTVVLLCDPLLPISSSVTLISPSSQCAFPANMRQVWRT